MTNPFVLTKEETERFKTNFGAISFQVQGLYIDFKTDLEFIKELTPPCFEVIEDQPIMTAMIEQYQTYDGPRFGCSTIGVKTSYKGEEGGFSIRMYTDSDMANNLGRESWGEGKKFAYSHLYKCGPKVGAMLERNGKMLMELSFDETSDEGPQDVFEKDFEIKAIPSHEMTAEKAFEWPLEILTIEAVTHCKVVKSGTGTVNLIGSPLDPLDAIPIREILDATYLEGVAEWTFGACDVVEDGDWYLPYYGAQKHDDYKKYPKAYGLIDR